ncbi:MAG TPA: hypothetical protein VHA75_21240 [Rugosimonospora sp.]|nr:hypothetical protein [Rugosimonospora sp.]
MVSVLPNAMSVLAGPTLASCRRRARLGRSSDAIDIRRIDVR